MPDAPYYNGDPDDQDDPNLGGSGAAYVCTHCPWTARGGAPAYAHHHATWHAVRGRNWPESWPDAVFACCALGLPHVRTA